MTWSYSGDPSSSDMDNVRFLIGDTITADQLLQNEEILSVLAGQPNPILAAAIAARAIAAKFSRLTNVRVGKTQIWANEKAEAYLALAKKLEDEDAKAAKFRTIPYAGGISISDKQIDEDDPDREIPFFERDLFENIDGSMG